MKSIIKNFLLILVAIAAGILGGCSSEMGRERENDGRPLVYASFYPIYDLASKAAGEFAEVRCLVPDGGEPHDWEPSPQDIAGLGRADLFFYSGAGFEDWVPVVIPELENGNLTVIETSAGIEPTASDGDNASLKGDPHVWLSPKKAKLQFIAICEALKAADPQNADNYAKNQEIWCEEFDKLDSEFAALEDMPRNKIFVTHEAFGYLCGEYGLEQISAIGYSPDAEPDPASIARVVDMAKSYGAKVVFFEEMSGKKTAEAIAKEIGAKTLLLSPLEGLTSDQRERGDDYFSIMRQNLEMLKEALG